MKHMPIEAIEADDDGLDLTWTQRSIPERIALAEILAEETLKFADMLRGTVTPRHLNREVNRFIPIEEQ